MIQRIMMSFAKYVTVDANKKGSAMSWPIRNTSNKRGCGPECTTVDPTIE
jgi:hypothetical protein